MNPESEAQECAITIVTVAEQLLKKWTMKKVIDGVYGVNGNLIKAQYEKIDKWAIEPKIVKKNKYVVVELIMDVKSKESVFKLYQHIKDYCNTHKIRLSARNTKLEYTKRVGFLTGPCLKIAAPKRYIEELNKYLGLEEEDGIIDVKKKFTFERGSRSKVLVICVIESKAKEADELLCAIRSPRFKYVSYQKSISEEKLKAMYHNDKNNEKDKYEILKNVSLEDELIDEKMNQKVQLEQMIMKAEKGSQRLFLAAEQGDGKHRNNVLVVLNQKM